MSNKVCTYNPVGLDPVELAYYPGELEVHNLDQ